MKKVFLDKLPKWSIPGALNGKIDWLSSIGYSIDFVYNDITGTIEILDYIKNKRKLYVKYCDKTCYINTAQILECQIGEVIGAISKNYRYNNNDENRKKVFMEKLPRIRAERNNGKIDWVNSINYKVKFIYGDIKGELEIIEYFKKDRKVCIKYNNEIKKIGTSELASCKLSNIVGYTLKKNSFTKNSYRYNVREIVNGTLEILSQIRIERKNGNMDEKAYTYRCIKCGWEGKMVEANLSKGKGCGVCCSPPRTIVRGINDLHTTAPWIGKMLVNKEEGYRYARNSTTKLLFKCTFCGYERLASPHDLYAIKSIACPRCGDGFSYPEKFIYSVLKQLNIEFETQLGKSTLEWCENYKYDFYIPYLNMIIEAHGRQHYEESNRGRGLREEQQNDKEKEKLALQNGINNYIILDCRESTEEYIKKSIFDSKLINCLDLSNINWLECEEHACGTLVKDICNMWNKYNGTKTALEIGKMFRICRYSAVKYLKIGSKLSWCNYNAETEKNKACIKMGESNRIKVICLENNKTFNSFTECCIQSIDVFGIKLSVKGISAVANGTRKQYKKYHFLKVSDYEWILKNITTNPLKNWDTVQSHIQKNNK